MLVQAQVVPWWGTGRPAEFSPSGSNPVTGTAHRQEDRGTRLQNRGDSVTACGHLHALSGNEVWEITSREETEDARESARQIPSVPPVPGTEAHWRSGSADPTAP